MFSRIEEVGKIKQDLTFCSMADNLNIGLEFYHITGRVDDKVKRLLESGTELLELLENDPKRLEESKGIIERNHLIAFELYNSLKISARHINLTLPEDISKKAREYRKLIEDLKNEDVKIPHEKIEEIQDFTDDIEVLLLHRAREGAEMLRSRKIMV